MKQLLEGTINNILDRKRELFESRIIICKDCKLYKEDGVLLGPVCNPLLLLDVKTNKTSKIC